MESTEQQPKIEEPMKIEEGKGGESASTEAPLDLQAIRYITDEHRNYGPTERDMFISVRSGEYQRLIWGHPRELRDRETAHWEAFMKYIADNGLEPLPEIYVTEERLGFRYLQGVGWKYKEAHEGIIAN